MEKYVDHIYYINLEHRKDRKEHIEKQIKQQEWKNPIFQFYNIL